MDDFIDPIAQSLWGLSFANTRLNDPKDTAQDDPYALFTDLPDSPAGEKVENGQRPADDESLKHDDAQPVLTRSQRLGRSEFRLLKFETGPNLCCRTSRESLNAAPAYIALSYSWGYVDVSHSIEVDGRDFLVSAAVHNALQSLRKQPVFEACDGNVWIDAVSINQQDIEEKTAQVQMMSAIYSKAAVVIVWLGDMTTSNRRGLEVIKRVNHHFGIRELYDDNMNNRVDRPAIADTFKVAKQVGVPYIGHQAWEDVVTIFQKGWFGRVWVIQELLYAESFMFLCGDTLIEDDIWHFAASLNGSPFLTQAVGEARGTGGGFLLATSLAAWREEWNKGLRNNMLSCLLKTLTAQATDPRDKLFAMVSLCNDIGTEFIDYKQDHRKVLLAFAIQQFKAKMPYIETFLSFAQSFKRTDGVPSWITCWFASEPTGCVALGIGQFSSLRQHLKIPRPLQMGIAQVGDLLALVIHTQKFDTIVAVLDPLVPTDGIPSTEGMQRDIFDDKYYEWLVAFYRHELQRLELHSELSDLTEGLGTYPSGEDIEEVYWRSKAFDDKGLLDTDTIRKRRSLCREKLKTDVHSILTVAATLKEMRASSYPIFSRECMQFGMQYEDLVEQYQYSLAELGEHGLEADVPIARQYATTKKGYVAWVPYGTTVGDELHLIDGARIPFLLRARDPGGYQILEGEQLSGHPFELVGDAYVHGLMTGVDIYDSGLLEDKTMLAIY